MSPPRKNRHIAVALTLLAAIGFTGCSVPGASSPTLTSTPTSTPTSAATSSPTTEAVSPEFSEAELAQACIDVTASAFGKGVEFDIGAVRVEAREVDPEWLVLVPAVVSAYAAEAQCTIGGTPEAPIVEMSNASIEPLPEEQIQNLIKGENEGGTE